MMSKDLGLTVVAGLASALVFLSVLTGGALSIPLIYLTPLPLALIGLSFGLRRVVIGSAVAIVPVLVAMPQATPVFAVVAVVPVFLLVRQGLLCRQNEDGGWDWYPPGLLLAWLAVSAVALLVLALALSPQEGVGLEDEARNFITRFVEQVAPLGSSDAKESVIALWSALFPAMLAGVWLVMAVLNGMLAQWATVKAGHALRPTPAYAEVDLPLWLLGAVLATAAVGATASGTVGYLGLNAAAILLLPYVFAGLATVHRALRRQKNAQLLFVVFYVVFFVLFGWALIALAGLGLVRHWTRLRRRIVGCSQEEK